ncbi:MAG: nucleotidyl transferase AbiEii/AbiGii toxin family protein [Candidatus Aminicenantes bacterium]|nr:nucleotidyl transferase AbiEii/AbiGii toxin family protein [Candidatus Aminicenantes bacterium]
MEILKELSAGYASPAQKSGLAALSRDPIVKEAFFLTGGTALSVFYLGHRVSDDIDLFTREPLDLPAVTDIVLRPWGGETIVVARETSFVSVFIRNVKVDFVVNLLAELEARPVADLESGGRLTVDSLEAIAANKLATLLGRVEPKDFIDFYFLKKEFPQLKADSIFDRARRKDAIFDDPPAAAMRLNEGLRIILRSAPKAAARDRDGARHHALIPYPRLLKPVDWTEFERVFEDLVDWLTGHGEPAVV